MRYVGDERCRWASGIHRCRFPAGHDGPHSWLTPQGMVAAGITAMEAEPQGDPAAATLDDSSPIEWSRGGEDIEQDRRMGLEAHQALWTVYRIVYESARDLAEAWEPIPDTALPAFRVRLFLDDIKAFARFYDRVAYRAANAQRAVALGDRIAGAIIRLDEGSDL